MLKFFSTPKKGRSKIIAIIIVVIFILGIIFLSFFVLDKMGLSIFPFFSNKSGENNTGLPKTPKGKVAPAPEFIEKMKNEQGRSPDGKKFEQPSSPPPIKNDK